MKIKENPHLSLISEEDYLTIKRWNSTFENSSEINLLHELFMQQALQTPNKIAVVCGEERVNYKELDNKSGRLANRLNELGVTRNVPVAVCLERNIDLIVALLGILKAGGTYIPLDPNYPKDRLHYILKDTSSPIVLAEENHHHLLEGENKIYSLQDLLSNSTLEPLADIPPGEISESSDLSYIIYTSGSTGAPKGVMIQHENAVAFLHWSMSEFSKEELDGVLASTSICFDLSVFEIFLPLSCGGKLILTENILHLSTIPAMNEVTLINTVPSAMSELLKAKCIPESVKVINLAGEPLRKQVVDSIYQLPHVEKIYNLYGPSEDTTYSTFLEIPRDSVTAPTIGKPIFNTSVFILNNKQQLLPIGEIGEIYISGKGLSKGYLNNIELTMQKFIPNPFQEINESPYMYKTGDLGRYTLDGDIEYLGRIDSQVKIRGHRVEIEEVEKVLGEHPSLEQVVVIATNISKNQLELSLVAYVKLLDTSNGGKSSISKIRSFIEGKLPSYMVPSFFVSVDDFPLLPNGKVDKKSLPAYNQGQLYKGHTNDQHINDTEKGLIEIFKDLLNIHEVDKNSDFFKIGGHSLLCLQLVSRIRDKFSTDLSITDIFNTPKVKDLSKQINKMRSGEAALKLYKEKKKEHYPLSSAQRSLWFQDRMYLGSPQYNIVKSYSISGQININVLKNNFHRIVDNHELLHASFTTKHNEPRQTLIRKHYELIIKDFSNMDKTDSEKKAEEIIDKELSHIFNLEKDNLLRPYIIKLSEEKHLFIINIHHIISDRWSLDILLKDLLLNNEKLDVISEREEFSFVDYINWERSFLDTQVAHSQIEYWKSQLSNLPSLVTLPIDKYRPKYQSFRGRSHYFTINPNQRNMLHGFAREEGFTPYMVLVSTFMMLVSKLSGSKDIVIGTPVSSRNFSELEKIVGFFVNSLPIRVDLSDALTFQDVLKKVKKVTLEAFNNKNIPFDVIKQNVNNEANPSYNAIFQLMFNYYDHPKLTEGNDHIEIKHEQINYKYSKFDMDFYIEELNGGLRGYIEYNSDLFTKESIKHFAVLFTRLLDAVLVDPNKWIREYLLLPEQNDYKMISIPKNQDCQNFKPNIDKTITDRLNKIISENQDRTAVKSSSETMSYMDLDHISNGIAKALNEIEIPNKRVGLLLNHDLPMIPSIIGVLKSGCAYVPINKRLPKERIATIIKDAQLEVILADQSIDDRLIENVKIIHYSECERNKLSYPILASPDSIAYILYTSGSTGKPKGVCQSHRNVLHHIRNYSNALQITNQDCLLLVASYDFDASIMDIFGALLNGAALLLADIQSDSFSTIVESVQSESVSILHTTPTIFRHLLEASSSKFDFVRVAVLGGETVSLRDFELFKDKFPVGSYLINGLGPTECTLALQYVVNHDSRVDYSTLPVGFPVNGVKIYLVDEKGQKTEHVGELVIQSDQIALGYLNNTELTAKSFHVTSTGERIYYTGDLARRLPNGSLQFLGRRDAQVKIRGIRIELGEIETHIKDLEGIQDAAVIGVNLGSHNAELVAYVVCSDKDLSSLEFRAELSDLLPSYMIPSKFIFVDVIPLTVSGKVNRLALTQKLNIPKRQYVAPKNEMEYEILQIWLQYFVGQDVGVEDDFFEIGGHSIIAMQLIWDVKAHFDIEIPFHFLYEYSTVRKLSYFIQDIQNKKPV
ncbi:non-ribosomal peptide synthetase [Bacillus sp. MUM 13]|uniref:non-ribosomal peptide synthetase n=1 Tax=Bacillus sp. MUM 13 TaxID=1678001 RepID=UPI0008F58805|nr:non-ribosomal peptide synthetase [Bacillus sp. MUM 13]OIK06803.1 hypothetical protein BIV59_21270 [Bacillus sp. MUM 13]